jgi:serine/threonine-protein kinase RsbW
MVIAGSVTAETQVDERGVIRLTVPADLRFRDVAVRLVAEACRMIVRPRPIQHSRAPASSATTSGTQLDLSDRFSAEMVSAVSEIFNNIAIHGFADRPAGEIAIEMTVAGDHLAIEICDEGAAFDLSQVPKPELDKLPEGGMGIHIAKACVDELDYTPGPPNVWRMTKYTNGSRLKRSRRVSNQPL